MGSELGDDEVLVLHELDWQIGNGRSKLQSIASVLGRYIARGFVAYGVCWCAWADGAQT